MSADLYFLDVEDPQRSQPLTLTELHRLVKNQQISGQTMIVSDLTGEAAPLRKFLDPVTGDASNGPVAVAEEVEIDPKSLQVLALAITVSLGLGYAFHLQQTRLPSTAFSRTLFGTPGLLDLLVAYCLYSLTHREAVWKVILIGRSILTFVASVSVTLGVVTHMAFAGAVPPTLVPGVLQVLSGALYGLGILLTVNDPDNANGRGRLGVGMAWIGLIGWVVLAGYQVVLPAPVVAPQPRS